MLDRLPTELLDHIVRLSYQPLSGPSSLSDRHSILKRLCLVSRTVRAVAQPLLWAHITVSTPAQVTALAKLLVGEFDEQSTAVRYNLTRSVPELVACVRDIDVWAYDIRKTVDYSSFLLVLAAFPPGAANSNIGFGCERDATRRLQVANFALAASSLTSLTLVEVHLHGAVVPLPALTFLSLSFLQAASDTLSALFSSTTLPALRVLVFDRFSFENPVTDTFAALSEPFLQQLDILQVCPDDSCHFPLSLVNSPFAFVFSLDRFDTSLGTWYTLEIFLNTAHLENLHVKVPNPTSSEYCIPPEDFGALGEIVEGMGSFVSPRALHLPLSSASLVEGELDDFVALCDKHGTEIWYGVEPGEVWSSVKQMRARAREEEGAA
ncbi:hypothetical protein JCM6882_000625 [Rhodosporidiobolus microsporus]